MKKCDRGLENAARGRRLRATFSRLRSQFFAIRTGPKPVNNVSFFSKLSNEKKTHASVTVTVVRDTAYRAKNQSDCRIRYRARLEKNKYIYFISSRILGGLN